MMAETDYCEALVRETDKDRYLATLFAPAARRPDLFALYAFDLETASVAHRVRDPVAGEVRLQWWHDAISSEQEGPIGHPVADAVTRLLRDHGIANSVALELIDARRRGLYPDKCVGEAEFELSASETSGAIFGVAAHVLAGPPGEPTRLAAHHAGVATAAAQIAPDALAVDVAALTRRHRDAVRSLIPNLPAPVLPAFLPLTLAVDGRSSLPQWRRQWVLWRASKNLAGWV
ncbi:MAG: phytoene/squalene synthase family protein [Pseudorhodoplanes sp.]|uniref:phytoene/squalene synthase family protein n=1 Tax=Pseudorhodoplanes sp. TaxID=1934341 RepID=UPI003D0A5094